MSQYIVVNDNEPNSHKVVWGKDDHGDAGFYLVVFDRNSELVVSIDQKHDGLDFNSLIEYASFYGVDPIYVESTLRREM